MAGIDEAGRGPLAGPLVACALHLPPGKDIPGVTDSKALTDRRRRTLLGSIMQEALGWGIGVVAPGEIDDAGMTAAVRLSFARAVEDLDPPAEIYLVDGNPVRDPGFPCRFLVRGDSRSLSIAAASIVAKVTRDDIMIEAHGRWPGYGFDTNKGYGTRPHVRALSELGPCPIHRMSFSPLREEGDEGQLPLPFADKRRPYPDWKGAEEFVAGKLETAGWKVIGRNQSWRGGEVDIIATDGETVAFVEVKLHTGATRSVQLEKVLSKGHGRMVSAAVEWMGRTGFTGACRFDLALVGPGPGGGYELEYLENAFEPSGEFMA